MLDFKVSPDLNLAITILWTLISIFAFFSTIFRLLSYKGQRGTHGGLQVLNFLTSYYNWSTANRIITSFWFIALGCFVIVGQIKQPQASVNSVGLIFILGIIIIEGLILYSDRKDYDRWSAVKSNIISEYSLDVSRGIVDSLNRLGVHVDERGNLVKPNTEQSPFTIVQESTTHKFVKEPIDPNG